MLKPVKLITIDLDGTLVDSVPDLAYSVDKMMQVLLLPAHGEDKVRQWVGNGVEKLVHRALTNDLNGHADDELFAKAYPLFLDIYRQNTCKRSQLYAGINEGLAWLTAQDYTLACVTNKAAQFTEPLLKDLAISDYFGLIISGDTLPKKKPDPMPLWHIAEHFNINPCDALMVGDSQHDVKAARAAGFQVVCVSYGYNHGEDICLAQPDAVIDSLIEIKDLIISKPR
jgi:phosphoglycolate phosphatase